MQITDVLKEKLANAKTEDERNAILSEAKENAKQAGIELDDAELDRLVSGGRYIPTPHSTLYRYICPVCGKPSDIKETHCGREMIENPRTPGRVMIV